MRTKSRFALLAAGCILFAYVLSRVNPAEVGSLLLRIRWGFLWITLLYLAHQTLRTLALSKCIVVTQPTASWKELLQIRLAGESVQILTLTGPFLSEPAKALLLRRQGIPAKPAYAGAIAEFLLYTLTSAALTIAGVLVWMREFELHGGPAVVARVLLCGAAVFLSVALVAIVCRIYLIGWLMRAISRIPIAGLRFDPRDVRETEDLLLLVLRDRPGALIQIVALELCAQFLLMVEIFVLLDAAGEAFRPVQPFLIEAVTKMTGAVFFFVPSQVGASEGVYSLVFQQAGLTAAAGFALAFVRRLRSLLTAAAGLAWNPLWSAK